MTGNSVCKIERFRIRNFKKEDCREAARLRFEAKKNGLLPHMGVRFYTEVLKGTCESRWGFGKVCVDKNDKIAGFVFAATDLKKYYKEIIIRRAFSLSFFAFLKALQQPKLIQIIILYLLYSKRVPFGDIKAEWLTMMVRREYRGRGIGEKLALSLTDEFKNRNITQYKSTVAVENIVSCRLHEKLGFKFLGTFELGGESINIYKYDI